jgi:fructose-bisphosphate aldolase class II
MNIDTDLQWAFADGIKQYMDSNDFLKSQIGNSTGADSLTKYYDPRKWLRVGRVF